MNKKITLIYILFLIISLSSAVSADEIPMGIPEDFASCTAGFDNDLDGLSGFLGDEDCDAFVSTATTTEPVVIPLQTGGFVGPSFGGGSSSGGSSFSAITSGTPISTVISSSTEPVVSTTCSDTFKTYMKRGGKNDVNEVKKLQKFLNIKETGYFGKLTFNAVKAFQLKYADKVLSPWGTADATGYFYKTTQKQANVILCPSLK